MIGKVEIAPSILSADFGNLRREVRLLEKYGADRIHIDVMDGHFVPNITFGPALIGAIRGATRLPFETHLMIDRPDLYIRQFADAGSDTLIVHHEARHDMAATIRQIASLNKEAGIAINPGTSVSCVEKYFPKVGMLLVMSVNPGFGGQKFIRSSLENVRRARRGIDNAGLRVRIGIDGGINLETGRMAMGAGADELIAGSSIFCAGGVSRAIRQFKALSAATGSRSSPSTHR